tara:strand:+ start:889 stop:1149 length:261 start_codon:yes stop_codon:yes gene_type:complete
MIRKILDAAALIAFVLSAGLTGGSFYLYRYVTSSDFQKQAKEKLIKEVKNAIPLPSLSGPALPTGALSPAQQKNEEKKALKFSNPF